MQVSKPLKVMTVFGTRPEAIKMAPLVQALQADSERFTSILCVTAQHRDMLDQVLRLFELTPDVDLDLMRPNQDLADLTARVLKGMRDVLAEYQPDVVLVHGDTTTTMATSLAAFYAKIPIGHVEAGLRTFDKYYPFPEEINRVVTDSLATLFFAPTTRSQDNLINAGVNPSQITLTGNTVIDALLYTLDKLKTNEHPLPVAVDPNQRMVLVTVHRRENFGAPLLEILEALTELIETHSDICLVLPVHPNPNVKDVIHAHLRHLDRVHLIPPQDYAPFCQLLNHATLILTDSGGIQEEAPSIQKPVLVLRDETERPEAVDMGTVKLVGPHKDAILAEANRLLTDPAAVAQMVQRQNPYGDGHATERTLEALYQFHLANQKGEAAKTPVSAS